MNDYALTLMLLIFSIMCLAIGAAVALENFLKKGLPTRPKRIWFAFAMGSLLLALQHGYNFELAFHTGLYDLREAVLTSFIALFFIGGFFGMQMKSEISVSATDQTHKNPP